MEAGTKRLQDSAGRSDELERAPASPSHVVGTAHEILRATREGLRGGGAVRAASVPDSFSARYDDTARSCGRRTMHVMSKVCSGRARGEQRAPGGQAQQQR